jgi:hypothetical protein
MLALQLGQLLPMEEYLDELPSIFGWLASETSINDPIPVLSLLWKT